MENRSLSVMEVKDRIDLGISYLLPVFLCPRRLFYVT